MVVMMTMVINGNEEKHDDEDDENGNEGHYDDNGRDNNSIISIQQHAKDDKDNKTCNSWKCSPIRGVMDRESGSLFTKVIAQ